MSNTSTFTEEHLSILLDYYGYMGVHMHHMIKFAGGARNKNPIHESMDASALYDLTNMAFQQINGTQHLRGGRGIEGAEGGEAEGVDPRTYGKG